MSAEHDISSALRAHADRYDPADDGWAGILSGVGAARARRRRVLGGAVGGLAVAGVAVAIGLTAGGGGSDVDAGPGPMAATTEAPPTSAAIAPEPTTTVPPTTTAAPVVEAGAFPGIWPFASQEAIDRYEDGDARFEDPVATAEAFARDYVGMLDPVVEDVRAAVPGSSGVSVDLVPRGEDGRPVPAGVSRTTVLLRAYPTSYGVDVWTVLSAGSDDLVLDTPEQGAVVGGVVEVRGRGTGYEGTVRAEVREDGMQLGRNLGEVIGMTGSMGELGPLVLDVPFVTSAEPGGAVVVTTDTGRDGVGAPAFAVVRIHFEEGGESLAGEPAGGTDCVPPDPAGEPMADEMDVTVFFICETAAGGSPDDDATFVSVTRRGPRSAGVLQAAMETYLGGATDEEEGFGVGSFTYHAAIEVDVELDGTTAIVDIDGQLVTDANGASTSAGSLLFRGALNRTVFQFPTVDAVEYRLDGSCEAFWEWQQVGGCPLVTRGDL